MVKTMFANQKIHTDKIQPHPGFDPVYDEAKEAVQKYIKQLNEHLEYVISQRI